MERYKRDRDSYGYNYFDCYDCEYYVSYHPCNRCYKKENTPNKWYESDEEVFRLEKYKSYFRFTREHFESSLDGNNWSMANSLTLLAILNGTATIKKLPWKPEYDEKYYIPSIGNTSGYDSFYWQRDNLDEKYYNLGIICKSKNEAIVLRQKMLAVVKEKNE